ncbi:DUF551 domain-containing protein [Agrobacterium pusense]|uniref:DUF551 domain-containing protein n=1 Tax=Agrobacterium pusense TaxID=648995 RepID=UPI002FE095F5
MQNKAIIRKAAEAIWAIRREEEDRCDMSLDDMGGEESSVWQEAKAALEAALSAAKPQPAPSVSVKALQMADETFRDLGWHDKYEATTAALAALSAQVQDVAGWQPIETAPKDGSEILALWKRSQIQSNGYGVVWFEDGSWRKFDYECLVSDPTHWMPLPSVPAAPAKQEG